MKTKKLFFWALMASVIAIISAAMIVGCKEDVPQEEQKDEGPAMSVSGTCWEAESEGIYLQFASSGTRVTIFYEGGDSIVGSYGLNVLNTQMTIFAGDMTISGCRMNANGSALEVPFDGWVSFRYDGGCSKKSYYRPSVPDVPDAPASLVNTCWVSSDGSILSFAANSTSSRYAAIIPSSSSSCVQYYYWSTNGQNISLDKDGANYLFTSSANYNGVISGNTITLGGTTYTYSANCGCSEVTSLAGTTWKTSDNVYTLSFGSGSQVTYMSGSSTYSYYYGMRGQNVSIDNAAVSYLFGNSATMSGVIRGDKMYFCGGLTYTNQAGNCGSATPQCSLSYPQNLMGTYNGTSISLTWNALSGATKYYIYRTMGSGSEYSSSFSDATLIDSTTSTSYTSTSGIYSNYIYYYFVKARNATCISNTYNYTSVSTACSLSAPTGVTATANGTRANVAWNSVSGASKYYIYRYTSASATSNPPSSSAALIDSATTTSGSYAMLGGYNYYFVKAKGSTCTSGFSSASGAVNYVQAGGTTSGLYMGIIGFNNNLYTKAIGLLNASTKSSYQSHVNGLTSANGTLLYYAVENAIASVTAAATPSDLIKVAIVTFTDGLDQGSHMLNRQYEGDNAAYLTALKNGIDNTRVGNVSIEAYSIGIRGSDVTDNVQFAENLQKIASNNTADVQYVNEATDMVTVNARFQAIANSLTTTSSSQNMSITMPGQANGVLVRFTFDVPPTPEGATQAQIDAAVAAATNSTLYIEGVYEWSTYKLNNIVYSGMTSTSGASVTGTASTTVLTDVIYNFANTARTAGGAVPTTNVRMWTKPNATSTQPWGPNMEFGGSGAVNTQVTRKSAVVLMVLDCSSSLGTTGLQNVKNTANDFITTLVNGQQ
jgi:hypothetical protein